MMFGRITARLYRTLMYPPRDVLVTQSAIMQALQTALGVAARSTGRGTSQTNYVRTGATHATVELVLDNAGPEGLPG